MATNSNVSFYADVWQHVQKSVWLLKDGRSVHGWLMKELMLQGPGLNTPVLMQCTTKALTHQTTRVRPAAKAGPA